MPELLEAAKAGDLPRVEQLLQEDADVDVKDEKKETPLIQAAREGHLPVVNALLNAGADVNYGVGIIGPTPLIVAIEFNHPEIAQRLLEAGADPNGKNAVGQSPLTFAAQDGHVEIVKKLIDAGATEKEYAFLLATSLGQTEVVRIMLEAGVNPNIKNENKAAIYMASESGHLPVVKLLLEHPSFELDTFTKQEYRRAFKNKEIIDAITKYIHDRIPAGEYMYLVMRDSKMKQMIAKSDNPIVKEWDTYSRITGYAELFEKIKADLQMCMETIAHKYVVDMINNTNNYVLFLENKEGLIKGLVIFKYVGRYYVEGELEPEHIKIELICGSDVPGIGTLLLDKVYALAKGLGIYTIKLESLTEVLQFYVKKGFECAGDGCLMEKEVTGGFRRTRRKRKNR